MAPESGTCLNALLLIGSIRLLAHSVCAVLIAPGIVLIPPPNNRAFMGVVSLDQAAHLSSRALLWWKSKAPAILLPTARTFLVERLCCIRLPQPLSHCEQLAIQYRPTVNVV
jgi:hypothetical protein